MSTWRKAFHGRPWAVVPVAAAIHISYAVALVMYDSDIAHLTALHVANEMFGESLPYFLLLAALLAISPMMIEMPAWVIHLVCWPQQLFLFFMALSTVQASMAGVYPDGTVKYGVFILTDQCWTIYLMAGHFWAMVRNSLFFD